MATTADFRNGLVLDIDGQLFQMVYFQHVKPGKGGAFVRTKLKNIRTGAVLDRTCNAGERVTAQVRALSGLYDEWARTYPEPKRSFELVAGRPISAATVATVRDVLRTMLDHADAGGRVDLPANVRRMAGFLDDITRHRVVKLAPDRFAEYVELTGRYAAASDRPSPDRHASAVGRVLSRGFLFAVLAAREQLRSADSGLRLGLRARLIRLLAHTHGLGPGVRPDGHARTSLSTTLVFNRPQMRGTVDA